MFDCNTKCAKSKLIFPHLPLKFLEVLGKNLKEFLESKNQFEVKKVDPRIKLLIPITNHQIATPIISINISLVSVNRPFCHILEIFKAKQEQIADSAISVFP